MNGNELLRQIPKMDELLRLPLLTGTSFSSAELLRAARAELALLREELTGGTALPSSQELAARVLVRARESSVMGLRHVINATGIILHTNLGRAPLCADALAAVREAAQSYSTLEYDPKLGARGSRGTHIEALLCELTGAPAAMAVNNNAAAILLALATLARGDEIVVSRGELVEIGDSFRVPDIMEQSGGRLVEVGATNKTHLRDYEAAIGASTAVLLKVHTSNYRIVGFSGDVPLAQLCTLGKQRGLPVVYDLGSGALLAGHAYPFTGEPTVPQALLDGADLVTFSGDKLLGGPQAGILLGSAACIASMKRNPLARALRLDKLSLAALEATLRLYRDPQRAMQQIPALRMLTAGSTELLQKAQNLRSQIEALGARCGLEVLAQSMQAGGGAVPVQGLPSAAVAVLPQGCSVAKLERALRLAQTPVIARIAEGRLLLDVSTIAPEELTVVAREVAQAL